MNHLQRRAWAQIVQQVNGLAVSGTIAALHRRGGFEVDSLADLTGNEAYLLAAERALQNLGWVKPAKVELYVQMLDRVATGEGIDWEQLNREFPGNAPTETQMKGHIVGCHLGKFYPHFSPSDPVFESLRWAESGKWTDLGKHALPFCKVYDYPLSYQPLLERVEELLFGDHRCVTVFEEEHLDRDRDVKFSGEVFSPTLAKPFLSLLLPLFNAPGSPEVVVDVGCGDGAVLETVAGALASEPVLVGADFSPIARERAAERLGSTAHILFGDIGDPTTLCEALEKVGVKPERAVFITKSVIHNRSYQGTPSRKSEAGGWISPVGEALSLSDVEQDLIRFFQRWKPFIKRYGMVIAEPYLVPEKVAASNWDRSLQPCLALTHAYSSQLLVPRESFLKSAEQAGLQAEIAADLGSRVQGHDAMLVVKLQ